MGSRKSFFGKSSHIFPASSESETHNSTVGNVLELDEAEVWNPSLNVNATNNPITETKKGSISSLKRVSRKVDTGSRVTPASSLPVNIPDWSKILKEHYKDHRKREDSDDDEEEGDDEGGMKIPPHEYLARTRGASLSVHEGIGRTLKGRDLRSVRNAIWKKVGFED